MDCERSLCEEVQDIPGAIGIDVSHTAGQLVVSLETEIAPAAVVRMVQEDGSQDVSA